MTMTTYFFCCAFGSVGKTMFQFNKERQKSYTYEITTSKDLTGIPNLQKGTSWSLLRHLFCKLATNLCRQGAYPLTSQL